MPSVQSVSARVIQVLSILLCSVPINAAVDRVEPPNWWTGMHHNEVQLLVQGSGIGAAAVEVDYPGVHLGAVHKADSPNYLFLNLQLSSQTAPGEVAIRLTRPNGERELISWPLHSRQQDPKTLAGFDSSDAVYLITPDRFANGDPDNDQVVGLREQGVDRSNRGARHGGDIRGIINALGYIDEMGFTAVWSSPLLTNDMPAYSYHGYAITDFYAVDPRFGSLADYRELAIEARKRGITLIQDQVVNHCGLEHWWIKDLPFSDWINDQANFEANRETWSEQTFNATNHRRTVHQDIYAASADAETMTAGWFVPTMPDLNHRNAFLARYLIQNSLWWIETLGLSGIRQDTYPYSDPQFINDWNRAILQEYPRLNIVGEEWSYNPLLIAYWQRGNINKNGYASALPSTMDFAMMRNIIEGLNESDNEAKNTGLIKIYQGLANDFSYPDPMSIMVFADNHDIQRIYSALGKDLANTQAALALVLTMPRIPQVYYGTEILMESSADPDDHGLIRSDFPGGWKGDIRNAFSGQGLSHDQLAMQHFIKTLLNYRKSSRALHRGQTLHFAHADNIYLMSRRDGDETVVVIINKNNAPVQLSTARFAELGLEGKRVRNLISGASTVWSETITLDQRGVTILTTRAN